MRNFNRFMRIALVVSTCCLLVMEGFAQVFPVDTLMRNGNRLNRINLVYLSDGYQSAQLPAYITNTTTINNALFLQTPFVEYKLFFNSFAVNVPSTDAGAKHPGTASDEGSSGGQPIANPNNYFQSTFDYFSIHRLLVPVNSASINSVLASNLPDYDQAFIVVNSPYYGGSGGAYATASIHSSSAEVAIHEIGHSFAGLADEYWAGDFYAAEKPNMTQNTNPATVKWKNWYGINNIGIFPYGASGNPSLWFRPHQLCKMQYLNFPFCSVCTERFIDRIHFLVNMIDDYLPATTSFSLLTTDPVSFSVNHLQTTPPSITVNWYLNGSVTPFASNQSSVVVPYASFVSGGNTIRAEVIDNTTLSKSYLPGIGYINNLTWSVFKGVIPIKLTDFTGQVTNRNEGLLTWTIENPSDLEYFELEKSRDGTSFASIKMIPKDGDTKKFSFTDADLFDPISYYRLKITERDQQSYYSHTIPLKVAMDKSSYKVYQDAASHQYHVTCSLNNPERIAISITNAAGQQILQKDFGILNHRFDHDINLSNYAAGVYYLSIFMGDKKYQVSLLAN